MKPILFSTPMVQAILNTKPGVWPPEPIDPNMPYKSQTRRVIKKKYIEIDGREVLLSGKPVYEPLGFMTVTGIKRPKYQPGDVLWVRETWGIGIELAGRLIYKANYVNSNKYPLADGEKWKPSIFMPREAARMFLEVKSVRIQKLQEMCVADCVHEGVQVGNAWTVNAKPAFMKLWDSINKKQIYSWEYNPWVWVYEFMRIKT